MFGAGELSFALFAEHIGAPYVVFGLLGGLPMVLGPLCQVLSANLLDRYKRRRFLVEICVITQVLCFLPLMVMPFWGGDVLAYTVLVVVVCLYSAGGQFGNPAWSSLIGTLVPSSRRAEYFARLSRDVSLIGLIMQLAVGGALWLAGFLTARYEWGRLTAWVFAGAFFLAGAARLYSLLFIRRMRDPPYEVHADTVFTFWQFIRRAPESNFVRFVLFVAFVSFGTMLAGPYFLPYWTRDLGYQSWQWVVLSSAGTLSSSLTIFFWGRFSHRFGNKKTMGYTSIGIALIPFLWLVSTDFYFLTAANFFSGAVWAGFSLSTWNYILEAVTPPKRARCVAYFNLVVGAGIFLGALAGGWIEPWLPRRDISATVSTSFVYLLAISGGMRLLACVLILPAFRELRTVESFSLRDWFIQITGARYPVGLLLEFFRGEDDRTEEVEKGKEDPL